MYRIGKEEIQAVAKVIESRELFKCNGGLQETMHCEQEMKELFGCQNAILMTSGKAALIAAMVACGIGPGDEVIVPAYTYIASAMAVLATGAIPVIAEIDESCTIDVSDAEKRIDMQTDNKILEKIADVVLTNNGSKEELEGQLDGLIDKFEKWFR